MKRSKKKSLRRKRLETKVPFYVREPCPNCGELGPHFVPPCLGEKGFFICKTKERKETEK